MANTTFPQFSVSRCLFSGTKKCRVLLPFEFWGRSFPRFFAVPVFMGFMGHGDAWRAPAAMGGGRLFSLRLWWQVPRLLSRLGRRQRSTELEDLLSLRTTSRRLASYFFDCDVFCPVPVCGCCVNKQPHGIASTGYDIHFCLSEATSPRSHRYVSTAGSWKRAFEFCN